MQLQVRGMLQEDKQRGARLVLAVGQRVRAQLAQHGRVGALLVGRAHNQAVHAQAQLVLGACRANAFAGLRPPRIPIVSGSLVEYALDAGVLFVTWHRCSHAMWETTW